MPRRSMKRRGGGGEITPAKVEPAPAAATPGKGGPAPSGSSKTMMIFMVVLGLALTGVAVYVYMNLDYILCRSRGSGHDFCNSKVDTMGKNEDRARRRAQAK
tara:strand:- start:13019 stop:13324 length:306 start_codon:yes stop_codon:yes gene_type:complete